MTIRQIWKNLTRNYRVKKSIRKIKADHIKGQSKGDLDTEFGKKALYRDWETSTSEPAKDNG